MFKLLSQEQQAKKSSDAQTKKESDSGKADEKSQFKKEAQQALVKLLKQQQAKESAEAETKKESDVERRQLNKEADQALFKLLKQQQVKKSIMENHQESLNSKTTKDGNSERTLSKKADAMRQLVKLLQKEKKDTHGNEATATVVEEANASR